MRMTLAVTQCEADDRAVRKTTLGTLMTKEKRLQLNFERQERATEEKSHEGLQRWMKGRTTEVMTHGTCVNQVMDSHDTPLVYN